MSNPTDKHQEVARAVAADLFTTSSGRKGDHLQIAEGVPPNSVYLAGWCEAAVADRIATALADTESAAFTAGRADANVTPADTPLQQRLHDQEWKLLDAAMRKVSPFLDRPEDYGHLAGIVAGINVLRTKADTAYQRGRADRQAEDAEIARQYLSDYRNNLSPSSVADAILAPSSGSYEARIRAEIAVKVRRLEIQPGEPLRHNESCGYNAALDDVLAVINGGEK